MHVFPCMKESHGVGHPNVTVHFRKVMITGPNESDLPISAEVNGKIESTVARAMTLDAWASEQLEASKPLVLHVQ